MELLNREICYRALQARDRRFDGRLFVGVTSTGIYCRPICPARTPKQHNCRFFPNAAAAHEEGFRACLRCRPEISPRVAAWQGTSNTMRHALALIASGFFDGEAASVGQLAEKTGVGERQLRRIFQEHLGASPVSVAQTRRILLAKQLLHETGLPMTDVAIAAGFGSVRRFNETFRALYGRPPSELRRRAFGKSAAAITLHAAYQPPYEWESMLQFLAARAVVGVEKVENGVYRRSIQIEDRSGSIAVCNDAARCGLKVEIRFPHVGALPEILRRVRHVFDLDADVQQIGLHLSKDKVLRRVIRNRPGLRAPGSWDAFELAVRAVLGQQITLAAARDLTAKLVRICGRRADTEATFLFPDARDVAQADLRELGMPQSRRNTLHALAAAVLTNPDLLSPAQSIEESVQRLSAISGIGEWTAQYIALRALRESDAFPATDVGILRGVARLEGIVMTPKQLRARAEVWRPWRGYAAQHLWTLAGELRTNG